MALDSVMRESERVRLIPNTLESLSGDEVFMALSRVNLSLRELGLKEPKNFNREQAIHEADRLLSELDEIRLALDDPKRSFSRSEVRDMAYQRWFNFRTKIIAFRQGHWGIELKAREFIPTRVLYTNDAVDAVLASGVEHRENARHLYDKDASMRDFRVVASNYLDETVTRQIDGYDVPIGVRLVNMGLSADQAKDFLNTAIECYPWKLGSIHWGAIAWTAQVTDNFDWKSWLRLDVEFGYAQLKPVIIGGVALFPDYQPDNSESDIFTLLYYYQQFGFDIKNIVSFKFYLERRGAKLWGVGEKIEATVDRPFSVDDFYAKYDFAEDEKRVIDQLPRLDQRSVFWELLNGLLEKVGIKKFRDYLCSLCYLEDLELDYLDYFLSENIAPFEIIALAQDLGCVCADILHSIYLDNQLDNAMEKATKVDRSRMEPEIYEAWLVNPLSYEDLVWLEGAFSEDLFGELLVAGYPEGLQAMVVRARGSADWIRYAEKWWAEESEYIGIILEEALSGLPVVELERARWWRATPDEIEHFTDDDLVRLNAVVEALLEALDEGPTFEWLLAFVGERKISVDTVEAALPRFIDYAAGVGPSRVRFGFIEFLALLSSGVDPETVETRMPNEIFLRVVDSGVDWQEFLRFEAYVTDDNLDALLIYHYLGGSFRSFVVNLLSFGHLGALPDKSVEKKMIDYIFRSQRAKNRGVEGDKVDVTDRLPHMVEEFLDHYQLDSVTRYSFAVIKSMWERFSGLRTIESSKPHALVIYAKSDWNAAYLSVDKSVETLLDSYEIDLIEVASIPDLKSVLDRIQKDSPFSVAYWHAHGNPALLNLSFNPNGPNAGSLYGVDLKSVELLEGVQDDFSPELISVYSSCSVAGGETPEDTILARISQVLPGTHHGSSEGVYSVELKYDKDGVLKNSKFLGKALSAGPNLPSFVFQNGVLVEASTEV